ncbi:DUF6232 family protein [Actinoplanes sp. NPDC051861]|uniref:DUF6232 family protein n=1 Tax=Actinoplanes sp. NPDC051861 TaxID=3155170 RepID=UPI00343C9C10
MVVFYRGPRALITDETFEAGRFRVALCSLSDVRQVERDERDGRRARLRAVGLVSGAGAMAVIPFLDAAGPVQAASCALVAMACAGFSLSPERKIAFDLVGVRDGRVTVLFSSADPREFGQVSRALRRALEYQRAGA